MAGTDVSICSAAFLKLGATAIASLTEENSRATLANNTYASRKRALLSIYPWRFTMKKAQLARLTAAPANEWLYAFQLPSDRLVGGAFAVFNTTSPNVPPITGFEVFGEHLLCNELAIWIDYQQNKPESEWPPYFDEFIIADLCSEWAYAITDQANLAEAWRQKAYGVSGVSGAYGFARQADSIGASQQVLENYDLINARLGYGS